MTGSQIPGVTYPAPGTTLEGSLRAGVHGEGDRRLLLLRGDKLADGAHEFPDPLIPGFVELLMFFLV